MVSHKHLEFGPKAIDELAVDEGVKLNAYVAPEGQWTIGIGSTYIPPGFAIDINGETIIYSKKQPVRPGMSLASVEEAKRLARHLINTEYGKTVVKHVKVPLTNSMYEALVNLTFNIGVNAFQKSTLLKHLNNKDYEKAAGEFIVWNKHYKPAQGKLDHSEGLIRRRIREMVKFIDGFNEFINKPEESPKRPIQ